MGDKEWNAGNTKECKGLRKCGSTGTKEHPRRDVRCLCWHWETLHGAPWEPIANISGPYDELKDGEKNIETSSLYFKIEHVQDEKYHQTERMNISLHFSWKLDKMTFDPLSCVLYFMIF